MGANVKVASDTGGAGVRALAARISAMKDRVLVGVPAGKTEPDGTSLAQVAAAAEFGTPTEPERSFLRSGIRQNMGELSKLSRGLLERVVEGSMGERQALDVLGGTAVGAIREKITEGPFTPNAAATIRAKGSDRPLIDSGALRQGITHVIESGGAP